MSTSYKPNIGTQDVRVVDGEITIENAELIVELSAADGDNVYLADPTGLPIGTAGNPLRFDPTGSTTQPISAAALPLPTGAATAANQLPDNHQVTVSNQITGFATAALLAITNSSLSSIDSKLTAPLSVTGPLTDAQLRAVAVPISAAALPLPSGASTSALQLPDNHNVTVSNFPATQPISAVSLPLPTGAATEATLATRLAEATFTGRINTLGQKTMASSTPVVFSSDQTALPLSADASTDTTLKAVRDAVQIMDDWDESDRAKVNSIVGQTGVQGGSGAVSANTQRVVLATDVGLPAGSNIIGTVNAFQTLFGVPIRPITANILGSEVLFETGIDLIGNFQVFKPTGETPTMGFATANSYATASYALVDTSQRQIVVDAFSNRTDTFTGTGNGTTVDSSLKPAKSFSIQVKGTGAAATAWTVVLEGSNDNTNFTTILTHATINGDGSSVYSGAALSPCLYYRSSCLALTLGGATNIVVTILGVP